MAKCFILASCNLGWLAGAVTPDRVLIFPHAFKTGGTSLKKAIAQSLRSALPTKDLETALGCLRPMDPTARREIAFVAGHFRFDEAEGR